MRINEISPEDKSFLTLKGISYDFSEDYNTILSSYKVVGYDILFRNNLRMYIDSILKQMNILFNAGFDETDSDIINIKEMYKVLEDVYDKL